MQYDVVWYVRDLLHNEIYLTFILNNRIHCKKAVEKYFSKKKWRCSIKHTKSVEPSAPKRMHVDESSDEEESEYSDFSGSDVDDSVSSSSVDDWKISLTLFINIVFFLR